MRQILWYINVPSSGNTLKTSLQDLNQSFVDWHFESVQKISHIKNYIRGLLPWCHLPKVKRQDCHFSDWLDGCAHLLEILCMFFFKVFLLTKFKLVCTPLESEHFHIIFNRPGVAGAVLQSPLSFNHSFSDSFIL